MIFCVSWGALLQQPKILGAEAFVKIFFLTIVVHHKRSENKPLSLKSLSFKYMMPHNIFINDISGNMQYKKKKMLP